MFIQMEKDNIHKMFEQFHKVLPKQPHYDVISSLAEQASIFGFENESFWADIEAKTIHSDTLSLIDVARIARAGAYTQKYTFSQEFWKTLCLHLNKLLDKSKPDQESLACYTKCIHILDKVHQLDVQLLKKFELVYLMHFKQLTNNVKIQIANIFAKNGYSDKAYFKFLEYHLSENQ